ncbi:unnamed protein product [Rotaria socialis]|nr:unnamed protein product [Rotaria socialis]CAF4515817.1 unnamed protein product [Rotaria socialis]CAF4841258.1 unnamed protein product [Rotaria socialis]CAF4876888.1 unnamed protein product [Rotaria socialis]
MSISIAATCILCSWTINFVSLIFMGHIGQAEFNPSSLANTISTPSCFAIVSCLNFGCDTLLPQYFGGNKRKTGIILQRARSLPHNRATAMHRTSPVANGLQKYSAIIWFVGFWILGLPLAYNEEVQERINLTLPSQASEYMSPPNQSASIPNTHENIELLNMIGSEKYAALNSSIEDGVQSGSNQQLMQNLQTTEHESLFKLVRIKLLILIPLISLFIFSLIMLYKS